ncbi:hypothetical protein BJX68DRAFT_263384 [Aspergillus pseudodeflectus]|uniref:Uncharacterized protein n=1 Tax=Aspergillus pseudodeflectus TaxID=176178 RepID=A0ABR4KX40_9EURO
MMWRYAQPAATGMTNGIVMPYTIRLMKSLGLIDFDLKSPQNGVALCGQCHIRYDDWSNPTVTLYPFNLEYFILFELRDRKRRRQVGGMRRVPTAEQYAQQSGLYERMAFEQQSMRAFVPYPPAAWHRAPVAALRRAIQAALFPTGSFITYSDEKRLSLVNILYYGREEEALEALADSQGWYSPGEDGDSLLGELLDD